MTAGRFEDEKKVFGEKGPKKCCRDGVGEMGGEAKITVINTEAQQAPKSL